MNKSSIFFFAAALLCYVDCVHTIARPDENMPLIEMRPGMFALWIYGGKIHFSLLNSVFFTVEQSLVESEIILPSSKISGKVQALRICADRSLLDKPWHWAV